jgi:hypothetical protein
MFYTSIIVYYMQLEIIQYIFTSDLQFIFFICSFQSCGVFYIRVWNISEQAGLLYNVGNFVSLLVFWLVTPCGLEGRHQGFGGTYCLHL